MAQSKRVINDTAEQVIQTLGINNYQFAPYGRNNWVFLTETECISIPRNPNKVSYSIRVAAIRHFKEHNIPTTPLIDHGFVNGIEYIITQRLNATNINVNSLTFSEAEHVHAQCGHWLKIIHNTSAKNAGRLNSELIGSHKSWQYFVEDYFNISLRRLSADTELYQKYGKVFCERFNKMSFSNKAVFLHGDYHIGNILFEGITLSAIIDLDIVMSGDPLWDLGHYQRTYNTGRPRGNIAFLKGYGIEIDQEMATNYAMIIWARKLASQAESRRLALSETIEELERILK